MPRLFPLLMLAAFAGCASFPQLDKAISDEARRSDYPTLQPVDAVLAQAAAPEGPDSAAAVAALRKRAKQLRARARILRQATLIDADAQDRMKAAYDRLTR